MSGQRTYKRVISTHATQAEAYTVVRGYRRKTRNSTVDLGDVWFERPQIRSVNRWAVVER